jgi:uncharacterized protein (TIGR00255 family)
VITSMTGFASVTREDAGSTVGVTLKAVNHRYLDLQVRAPQAVSPFEPALRAAVQRRVARGRVEVSVAVQARTPPAVEVELNEPLIAGLAAAIEQATRAGLVMERLSAGDLLRLPQALAIRERPGEAAGVDAAALEALVVQAVEAALDELQQMRVQEGRALRADLDARRAGLARALDRVEAEAAKGSASLRARLTARIAEIAAGGDPGLVALEIVKFAARSDISEEIVRFRAHLEHWALLSDGPEPCGRKLDFLLQEMNREINTIGSKAEGPGTGELIVQVKADLEKMREQVQNVE